MGFGIDDTIYPQSDTLDNALTSLQYLADLPYIQEKTIIAPHLFGPQVTGGPFVRTITYPS